MKLMLSNLIFVLSFMSSFLELQVLFSGSPNFSDDTLAQFVHLNYLITHRTIAWIIIEARN